MKGQTIQTKQWVHGQQAVVCVEVPAIQPTDDPDELFFKPDTIRLLEQVQQWADEGNVDELARYGPVYVRKSA